MTDAIIVFCAISAVALVVIALAVLQCNKRGPVDSPARFEQYKNQLQPASGSFTQTCRNCRGNANRGPGFMTCECQDRSGKWVPTDIEDLRRCKRNGMSPLVKNVNGQLMCEGLR
jgi:hypothetical protein